MKKVINYVTVGEHQGEMKCEENRDQMSIMCQNTRIRYGDSEAIGTLIFNCLLN